MRTNEKLTKIMTEIHQWQINVDSFTVEEMKQKLLELIEAELSDPELRELWDDYGSPEHLVHECMLYFQDAK